MSFRTPFIVVTLALAISGCTRTPQESSFGRGKRLFDEGKWSASVDALTAAIAKNPLDADAYLYRGRAYHCQGREHISQAIADFNEAIRLNPKSCEGYYSRAEAHKEKGDREKALSDSLIARRLDPNYAAASNRFSNPSIDEFRQALDSAADDNTASAGTGHVSTETLLDSATEEIPLPRSSVADEVLKSEPKAKPTSPKPRSTASADLRDAYGLPLSTERRGSVTEELFGSDNRGGRSDRESKLPSLGSAGPSHTVPNWPLTGPQPAPQPLDTPALPRSANRPPPVGWNPFQPRGFSPYAPTGPRSTGLRGDPTQRDLQAPYDRRFDRIPREEIDPEFRTRAPGP